jgi:hypothetical protein
MYTVQTVKPHKIGQQVNLIKSLHEFHARKSVCANCLVTNCNTVILRKLDGQGEFIVTQNGIKLFGFSICYKIRNRYFRLSHEVSLEPYTVHYVGWYFM